MTDSVVKTWAAEMRSMRTIAITIVLVITCLQLRVENAFATAEGCAVVAKTPDGFLNIRQTPSSDGPVLGQVTPGDFVAIVRDMKGDPSGKWSYLSRSFEVVGNKVIKERNISGWAATRYLAIECPENLQQIVLHRPSFSVGGMRLSQTINLGSNFRCKTSDQFTDFDWCIAASQERGARGEFEQRTTVLRSSDGRAFYLNRFLEPAFFAPKEIEHDIDDLIAKFGEKPVMLSMPKRTGLRGGIIAKWGGLTLHQLTKEQAAPLAEGQSPKVGLLVDFLNDFMTSAKRDLPLYRLEGSAGYIYNATFGAEGRGKLRFLAADPSALNGTSASQPMSPSEPKGSGSADGTSSGSGFFVSTKGHVLTNAHVVEGCRSITVSQHGQPPSEGRLIAKDSSNDLALIQTKDQPSSVPPLRGSVRLGEQVAVYGFPLSGILASTGNFTLGNVTATAGLQDDSRILQVSSPVQPGNSGGPLLDEAGNVVGIVVAKLDAIQFAAITKDMPQNINFAIKAAVVQTFLETNGIASTSLPSTLHLAADDIAEKAKSFTVFVECNASQRP